jgi:hypothetical protein
MVSPMTEALQPLSMPNNLPLAGAVTAMPFLAPPPLIDGEDSASYDELLARISGTLKPADILEEIWVRDVVDLTWDVLRLRRLKVHLLRADAHQGMAELIGPLLSWDHTFRTAVGWRLGEEAAVKTVDATLAAAGLTVDAATALTFARRIHEIERIDRMTMAAEGRRNAILREIERHRTTFARTLRRAVDGAEETEIKVLAAQETAQETVQEAA